MPYKSPHKTGRDLTILEPFGIKMDRYGQISTKHSLRWGAS